MAPVVCIKYWWDCILANHRNWHSKRWACYVKKVLAFPGDDLQAMRDLWAIDNVDTEDGPVMAGPGWWDEASGEQLRVLDRESVEVVSA